MGQRRMSETDKLTVIVVLVCALFTALGVWAFWDGDGSARRVQVVPAHSAVSP